MLPRHCLRGRIHPQARMPDLGSADESTSLPAIPVLFFIASPPRATACTETCEDLRNCLPKTTVFLGATAIHESLSRTLNPRSRLQRDH
jgi:hypothetical protein